MFSLTTQGKLFSGASNNMPVCSRTLTLALASNFFLPACSERYVKPVLSEEMKQGEAIVFHHCYACHEQGMRGAPRIGNVDMWKPRIAQGETVLIRNALQGSNKMPARGGNPDLRDEEIIMAVRYMVLVSSDPE